MPLNKIRKNSCINRIFLPKFWAQIVVAAYIRDKLLSAAVNWLVFTINSIKAVFNRSLHRSLHHAIKENSQGKLPTVPLPFISCTCTACLAMWLLRSCLATSFSPIDGLHMYLHTAMSPEEGSKQFHVLGPDFTLQMSEVT